MASKVIRYSAHSVAFILVVLAIVAVVNFISSRHFRRVDLTETKDFTVSNSTKQILGSLDDVVDVKVYFSKKLPPHLIGLRRQVKDVLDEYRAYSHGRLKVRFIDPEEDPKEEERARFLGIPQVQLQVIEKDQAQVMKAYLGIAILYGDKKEVIPVVRGTENLEYDLTSAILKVSSEEEKTVAFLSGHNERDPYDEEANGCSVFRQELDKQYRVRKVDTSKGDKIPDDVDTLIVAGPEKLSERDKYEIDQFIMRGGRAIFLIDPIKMEYGLFAQPLETGLDDMLEHYGVKLGRNLTLDRFNENASFRSGFVAYSLPYPFWVKVIRSGLNREHVVTSELEDLVLPWTSSLEPKEENPDVKAEVLASSSKYSWTIKSPYNLNPNQNFAARIKERRSYPLVVALSGKFKSFYADKPIPEIEGEKKDEGEKEEKRETIKESQEESQILVVGNSHFATNNFVSQFHENMVFLLNAVDWMTLGDKLIGIRSHTVTDRPLKELSPGGRNAVKWLCTFGMAGLVAAAGVVRFWWRRFHAKLGGVT
jgi:gliding-associated putative ABC transporter substrate-binding component GldG